MTTPNQGSPGFPDDATRAEMDRLWAELEAAESRGDGETADRINADLMALSKANGVGDRAGFDPDTEATPPTEPQQPPSVIARAMLEAAAAGDTAAVAALQRLARTQSKPAP